MASNNQEVSLTIAARATGEAQLRRLADEISTLRTQGAGAEKSFGALSSRLRELANQQALIGAFARLKQETATAAQGFKDAAAAATASATELRTRQRAVEAATTAERAAAAAVQANATAVAATKSSYQTARAELDQYRASLAGSGRYTQEQRAHLEALRAAVGNTRDAWRSARAELDASKVSYRSTTEELTAANRALSSSEAAFRRFRQAAAEAKQAQIEQRNALAALRQEMAQAGINTTALADAQRRLNAATAELQTKMEAARAAAAQVGQGLDQAFSTLRLRQISQIKEEMGRVQASLQEIARSSGITKQELERAVAATRQRLAELNKELKSAEDSSKRAGTALEQAFSTLRVRSVAQITAEAARVRQALNEISKASGTTKTEMERAANAARQRLIELNQELRKTLDGSRGTGNALAEAFSTLRIRNVAQIKQEMDRVKQSLDAIARSAGTTKQELDRATSAARQRMIELSRELKNAGGAADGLAAKLKNLAALIGGPQVLGIAALAEGLRRLAGTALNAGLGIERATRSMTMIVGSADEARRQLEYVRSTANRLGLDVLTTSESFGKFTAAAKGSALEGEGAREVFEAVAEAVAVLGLSTARTENVFLALQQMMSKGVVNMEEFRQQLGESLPIATEALARGMEMSRSEVLKLIETGTLASDVALPALAKGLRQIGAEGGEQVDTLTQAIARFRNSFTLMGERLQDSAAWDFFIGATNVAAMRITELTLFVDTLTAQVGNLYDAVVNLDFGSLWDAITRTNDETTQALIRARVEIYGTANAVEYFGQEAVDAAMKMELAGTSAATTLSAAQEAATKAVQGALKALTPTIDEVEKRIQKVDQDIQATTQRIGSLVTEVGTSYQAATALLQTEMGEQIALIQQRYAEESALLETSGASERQKIQEGTRLLREAITEQVGLVDDYTRQALQNIEDERIARSNAATETIQDQEELRRELLRIDTEADNAKRNTLSDALQNYQQHINALIQEETRHLSEIQRLEALKAQAKMTTEQKVRELRRQQMTDEQATEDRITEINELSAKAREALAAGEFSKAQEFATKAQNLATQVASQQINASKSAATEFEKAEQLKTKAQRLEAQARVQDEKAANAESASIREAANRRAKELRDEASRLEREAAQASASALKKDGESRKEANKLIERTVELGGLVEQAITKEAEAHKTAAGKVREARTEMQTAVTEVKAKVDELSEKLAESYKLAIEIDSAAVDTEVRRLDGLFAEKEFLVKVFADLKEAETRLDEYRTLLRKGETLPADADFSAARQALAEFQQYAKDKGEIKLAADTSQALTAIEAVESRLNTLNDVRTQSDHTVETNVDAARAEIQSLNGQNTSSTHTIYVTKVETNATGGLAGRTQAFARGGRVAPLMRRGRVPGAGNKDTVRRTLEAGAYVVRKAAVAYHGGASALQKRIAQVAAAAPRVTRTPAPRRHVNAVLMPGEVVVPRNVVSQLGGGFFDALNSAATPVLNGVQAFAQGGPTGETPKGFKKMDLWGSTAILARAERLGGIALRKKIQRDWEEARKRASKIDVLKAYGQMLQRATDELDRIEMAQQESEKRANEDSKPKKRWTGVKSDTTDGYGPEPSAPKATGASQGSGAISHTPKSASEARMSGTTVNIQINGNPVGSVNVASQGDAATLQRILEQLATESRRAAP